MRQNADFFGDVDLVLLFIASRLKEAKALEAVLDQAGVDYLIETDTYRGGFIFVIERIGRSSMPRRGCGEGRRLAAAGTNRTDCE